MISGAELTAWARLLGEIRRLLGRPDRIEVIKQREARREEIRRNLKWPEKDSSPEVLVVQIGKEDEFGKPDNRLLSLTPSPWFKYEGKEIHDRGLEVFTGPLQRVEIKRGKARRVSPHRAGAGIREVWVVGRIAYERIGHIDWRPDPYYAAPRFYVGYGLRGPFKEVVLYEGSPSAGGYLYEIQDVKYIAEGRAPWRRIALLVRSARFSLRARREQKRFQRSE
jgi:hypothetical protein